MTSIAVTLPDDLAAFAEARAAEERMDGVGAYVATLVERDRAEAERVARLEAAIDEGLASPIVDTTIDEVIARGRKRHGLA